MARPEWPILATGAVTFGAGYAREKRFPKNGVQSLVGFAGLLVIASALGRTKIGPVVNALAWLMFIGVLYGAFLQKRSNIVNRKPGTVHDSRIVER